MFRMFPIHTTTNRNVTNVTNTRSTTRKTANLQFTNKVFTVSQIYNTKASSCSSCGGGRR